jgi:hypothetical protein
MLAKLRYLKYFVLSGLMALLVVPTPGLTQNGAFPGGGGPPGGGFPGGGRFPGGGGFGGGMNADPNERFNQYAGGKDVWKRSEITDPNMQRRFDFAAQMVGSTNGEITRQQYVTAMQQMQRGGGFFGGGRGGAAPAPGTAQPGVAPAGPGAPGAGPGGWNPDAMIESWFRRYDKNGDGLLNNDEMPEALKAERDRWDTNKDGFIDLNEFKAYAQARMQQAQVDRGAQGFGGAWGGPGAMPVPELPVEDEKDQRPVVYRAGNLPRELPAWFKDADTDQDGQVGLYEWKAKGWAIEEFQKMDRNNDGFLTVEEVLRYQKDQLGASGTAVAAASPGDGGFATAAGNGPPGFGNRFQGFGNGPQGFGNRPRGFGNGGQGNGNAAPGNGGGRRRGGG